MKNICFLSLNGVSPWGGSEDLWYKTALVLLNQGYCVFVIVLDWREQESTHSIFRNKCDKNTIYTN